MTTLRAFILAGSSLPTGNTVRDHLKNPATLGPGGLIITEGEYIGEIVTQEGISEIATDEEAQLVSFDQVQEIVMDDISSEQKEEEING